MEQIWEYLSEHLGEIVFRQMKDFSPYCEMEEGCLYQDANKQIVEINSFYRYENIFFSLLVNEELSEGVRNWLFDVLFHYLLCLEFGKGCNEQELRIRRQQELLCNNSYGEDMTKWYLLLTKQQKYLLGYHLECQRECGASIHNFAAALTGLVECVVYKNLLEPKMLIIYTEEPKKRDIEEKIERTEELLLPLDYTTRVVYQEHIGILGEENTMMIEKITIF